MEKLKGVCCDHSCMLENYAVVMLTGRSYIILACLVYFNERKWETHASYSLSAFHSSCGMKKRFCAQAQDFRVVPWEMIVFL